MEPKSAAPDASAWPLTMRSAKSAVIMHETRPIADCAQNVLSGAGGTAGDPTNGSEEEASVMTVPAESGTPVMPISSSKVNLLIPRT